MIAVWEGDLDLPIQGARCDKRLVNIPICFVLRNVRLQNQEFKISSLFFIIDQHITCRIPEKDKKEGKRREEKTRKMGEKQKKEKGQEGRTRMKREKNGRE